MNQHWVGRHSTSVSIIVYFRLPTEYHLLPRACIPGGRSGGGGVSLIWPRRICAAEQGMILRVLSLKQGLQFHYLASLTWFVFGSEAFKRV